MKWAETEGAHHLDDALAAFKEAQLMHPDSENAVRSFWRMGQVHERMGFYYEAIGSFKRILLRHPNSRFAPLARIGIAETYRGWKKWKEAADAYEQIDLRSLSQEDQASVLLGHADSLYQQADFKTAYQKYERGGALSSSSKDRSHRSSCSNMPNRLFAPATWFKHEISSPISLTPFQPIPSHRLPWQERETPGGGRTV